MTDERQPRGAAFGRRRPVMDGENPANRILINRSSRSQIDLLGDLGTSPDRIALFHLHDSVDQVCHWAFGAWLCSLLWREQQSVLSLNQGAMKLAGLLQIVAQAGANIEVVVCSRLGDHKLWIDVLEQSGYDVLAEPYGHHEEIRRVVEMLHAPLHAPLASAGALSYKPKVARAAGASAQRNVMIHARTRSRRACPSAL